MTSFLTAKTTTLTFTASQISCLRVSIIVCNQSVCLNNELVNERDEDIEGDFDPAAYDQRMKELFETYDKQVSRSRTQIRLCLLEA